MAGDGGPRASGELDGEDDDRTLSPRVRALIDSQFAVMVAAVAVLALAGGWLTYSAHVDSGTHAETRTVGSWETASALDHRATVVRPNGVFPVGSRLENRTVYFTRVSPVLNGTFRFGFDATGEGSLAITTDADLVVRAVSRSQRGEGTVLWRLTRDLGVEESTLAPGERHRHGFSLNVSAVRNRSTNVSERLGVSGRSEIRTAVVVTALIEGEALGNAVSRNRSFRMGIEADESTYRVTGHGANRSRHRVNQTVRVPNEPGPLEAAGGPFLLVAGVAGLAGLGIGRHRGWFDLTDRERERLTHRAERGEFEDWITTGRVPPEALDRPRIEVESLEGLVDVAIDTDERVIEQADGSYFVLADPWLYTYDAPVEGKRVRDPADAAPLRERSGSTAADVVVADVSAPETVVPGRPLSVDAVVANEGEVPATATVAYRVDRVSVADHEIRLAPGERRRLSFVLSGGETADFPDEGVWHGVVIRDVTCEREEG
jgi:hypothetical protein